VIEQENGVERIRLERSRTHLGNSWWDQRYATGLADALSIDDTPQVGDAIRRFVSKGVPPVHRSSQVALYRNRIEAPRFVATMGIQRVRALWATNCSNEEKTMSEIYGVRGTVWFRAAYWTSVTYAW